MSDQSTGKEPDRIWQQLDKLTDAIGGSDSLSALADHIDEAWRLFEVPQGYPQEVAARLFANLHLALACRMDELGDD